MFDMDAHIVDILDSCLTSPHNLRAQFSDHAKPYFSTGFNWLEIDSIITAIMPRFHQRIEGTRTARDGARMNTGAPSDIIAAYDMEPIPGLTPDSFGDYGASNAVTALDMRPTTRGRARRNPVVLMGTWTNMAEIAVGTAYATYDVHNVENYALYRARMLSGAMDRLNRARFLRMICENMKRSIGITDTVAFPRDNPANMPYWPAIIGGPATPPGSSMHWIAGVMVTETVQWSWTVNSEIPAGGSTLTGIRTVSSMWRCQGNTEWGSVSMRDAGYDHDTTVNRWSDGFWLQLGQGVDAMKLEAVLGRLNVQTANWEITYKSHPANNEIPGYSWAVDSTRGGMLAGIIGWNELNMSPPTEAVWGWGLQSMIKDFPNNVLKTITIGRVAAMVMSGSTFSDDTLLYRGTLDSPVGNSFNIRVLDSPRGMDASHFQAIASKDHPPGAQKDAAGTTPEAKIQAQIAELTRQLAELSQPRGEGQGRVNSNRDDDGPKPSDEALVGGATRSDKQGMGLLKEELGAGGTRALTTKQAVRPLAGAWEGEGTN